MKTLLSSLLLFCAAQAMALTNNYLRFVKHNTKFEYAQMAAALPDGNAVLVSHNFTDSVLHLVKVNMFTGAVVWDKQYAMNAGLLRDFYVSSFQYTSGNRLLLGGQHHQNGFPNTAYPAVLCFDTSGTLLWNLADFSGDHYGGTATEIFPGRCVVIDGNYDNAHSVYKSQFIKVNSANGASLSAKEFTYPAGNFLGFSGMAPAGNSNFMVTGIVSSFYNTPFHYDITLTKMDSALNVLWAHAYRDTIFNSITAIAPYRNGGWLLLGAGFYDSYKENGSLLIAVDSAGRPLWAKQYSDTAHLAGGYVTHFAAASLTPASDGNYLMSGSYEFPGTGDVYSNAAVVKVDSSGNMLFARTYGATTGANPLDNATSVFDIGGSNYFFAGRTGYNGIANIIFGQDNPLVAPRAACFSHMPFIGVTNVLPQIRDTTIVLTAGPFTSPLGGFTYNTQANTVPTDTIACGRTESVGQQASQDGQLAVYPNPARATASFEWKGGALRYASLQVYDVCGRLIVQVPFPDGRLVMNTADLQRGVYYYRLSVDGGIAAKGLLVAGIVPKASGILDASPELDGQERWDFVVPSWQLLT